jgi:uncharacterized RDD family membrane protein YckC
MNSSLQGHYAGFISRLIAYVIDLVIISVSLFVITWTVNTTIEFLNLSSTAVSDFAKILMTGVTIFLFLAGYFILFWALAGQTPGKLIMGLRIVTLDGQQLSLGRSIRRFVGYILSFLTLYIGFLWILVDDRRQGFHDKIAGTCVIYVWAARPGDFYLARDNGSDRSGESERQQAS